MSQSHEQDKEVEVIKVTAQDLKDYAKKIHDKTTEAKDFCQYLKENYKKSAKEVIADISGQTFSNIDLSGIDLGTVIAVQTQAGEEKEGHSTQFQHCNMNNAKLRSAVSIQGPEFTHCTMHNMLLNGDIKEVVFGKGSDIQGLNLTEAHNIHKCVIDPGCKVSEVKLSFPDRNSLEQYAEKKNGKSAPNAVPHRRTGEVPDTPDVDLPSHHAPSPAKEAQGGGGGIMGYVGRGLWGAAVGAVKITAGTAYYVASGVNYLLTTDNDEGPEGNSLTHDSTDTISRILDSGPSFSDTVLPVEESNKMIITQSDIDSWIKHNEGKNKNDKLSLEQYVNQLIAGDEKLGLIPYMANLNLQGRDFADLDFGHVIISQCDFSGSKFERVNMNALSIRDCHFSGCIFSGVNVAKTDFTRTSFCGAQIDNTTFKGAIMADADFSPGDLPTKISNSNLDYVDMRMADLNGTVLKNSSLNNTNMQDVTGGNALLFNVNITGSNLTEAELTDMGMKDSTIRNSIASGANLEGAALNNVQITNFNAQEINLNNMNAQQVTIKDSDISHGTMNEARLADVVIDGSDMTNLQAQQIKTYAETIPVPEASKAEKNMKAVLAKNAENTSSSSEGANYDAQQADALVAALEAQEVPQGLTISNTNAKAADLSGSHIAGAVFDNVDASHAKIQNIVLQDSEIKDSNLHGANISGVNGNRTEIENTKLEGNDLTDANLTNVTMGGGSLKNSDISGANITDANIGTSDAKVEMEEIKADVATNFARSEFNTVDPGAKIKVSDPDGAVHAETPAILAEKAEANQEIIASAPQQLIASAASKVNNLVAGVEDYAAGFIASPQIQTHAPSKGGRYLGAVVGAVLGVAATAFIVGTFGFGLIPIAATGAIAVIGGAIGGAAAGNFIQNTASGQNLLTTIYAMLTVTFLGPVATAVIPAMMLYNFITGKKSPMKSAVSTLMDTFVAKPMKALAGGIGKFVPSQQEVKEAQITHKAREERQQHLKAELQQVNAVLPKSKHEQGSEVAKQQALQEQHRETPVFAVPQKPEVKEDIKSKPQVSKAKTSWREGVKPEDNKENNKSVPEEKLPRKAEIRKTFIGSHAGTIKEQESLAKDTGKNKSA